MVRTTSDVWEHYDKVDDGEVKCKLCNKSQKYSGGTSNLRNHLDRYHAAKYSIPKSPTITKFTRLHTCTPDRRRKITKMLSSFIAKDMRPINVIQVSVFYIVSVNK